MANELFAEWVMCCEAHATFSGPGGFVLMRFEADAVYLRVSDMVLAASYVTL